MGFDHTVFWNDLIVRQQDHTSLCETPTDRYGLIHDERLHDVLLVQELHQERCQPILMDRTATIIDLIEFNRILLDVSTIDADRQPHHQVDDGFLALRTKFDILHLYYLDKT